MKPEFWTDPVIVKLSYEVRLFYIGLWNFADDYGCIEDEPERLKMWIFPADPVNPETLIQALVSADRLERREADGQTFLYIRNFQRHQRIDKRAGGRFPLDSSEPLPIPTSPAESRRRSRRRKTENGSSTKPVDVPPFLSPLLATLNRVVEGKRAKELNVRSVLKACKDFADRDLHREAERFESYWLHGEGENAPRKDIAATWRTWLKRSPRAFARNGSATSRVGSDLAHLDEIQRDLEAQEAAA